MQKGEKAVYNPRKRRVSAVMPPQKVNIVWRRGNGYLKAGERAKEATDIILNS